MRLLPSSRFMPIQSQPTAWASSTDSLHSWSSQAWPMSFSGWVDEAPVDADGGCKVARTASCGCE